MKTNIVLELTIEEIEELLRGTQLVRIRIKIIEALIQSDEKSSNRKVFINTTDVGPREFPYDLTCDRSFVNGKTLKDCVDMWENVGSIKIIMNHTGFGLMESKKIYDSFIK